MSKGRPRSSDLAEQQQQIADRFAELREAAGFTSDAALAQAANISRSSISLWTMGLHQPTQASIDNLASVLGVPSEQVPFQPWDGDRRKHHGARSADRLARMLKRTMLDDEEEAADTRTYVRLKSLEYAIRTCVNDRGIVVADQGEILTTAAMFEDWVLRDTPATQMNMSSWEAATTNTNTACG